MTKTNGRLVSSILIVFSTIVIASTNNILEFVRNTLKIDLSGSVAALFIVIGLVILGFIDTKIFQKL